MKRSHKKFAAKEPQLILEQFLAGTEKVAVEHNKPWHQEVAHYFVLSSMLYPRVPRIEFN